MRRGALLLLLLAALPARSEEVVTGLSQTRVAITTDFTGSEILIYGAVKREAPPPPGPFDIIVVLVGPAAPVTVFRKERRLGLWVNGTGVEIDSAPSLYAVATSRPFHEILSYTDDFRYHIGLDHVVRLIGNPTDTVYPEVYRQALIRLRRARGLYFENEGGVRIDEGVLFQTSIALPSDLVEGTYRARVFLLRDKAVVSADQAAIEVRKVGFERWIYTAAKEYGALYGLGSILVALAAGWLASALFRLIFA